MCNYVENVDTWELHVLLNLDIALKNQHNATDGTVADERDIYGYRALPGRRGNRFEAFLLFKHCINAKVKQKHHIANSDSIIGIFIEYSCRFYYIYKQ